MSYISFASGGTPIVNPDTDLETIGAGANGTGTTVTSSGSANTKGSWVQLTAAGSAGVTVNNNSELTLWIGKQGSASDRLLMDISLDGGTTVHVANLYIHPGSTPRYDRVRLPINVPAGSNVQVRCQAQAGTKSVAVFAVCMKRTASTPPNFTSIAALNVDTAATRPSATDVSLGNTYVELVASTAATYGGLIAILGDNGTVPALEQTALITLGVGAAAAEVAVANWGAWAATSTPYFRSAFSPLVPKAIASGSRIAAKLAAVTPGTDNARIGLYGLVA